MPTSNGLNERRVKSAKRSLTTVIVTTLLVAAILPANLGRRAEVLGVFFGCARTGDFGLPLLHFAVAHSNVGAFTGVLYDDTVLRDLDASVSERRSCAASFNVADLECSEANSFGMRTVAIVIAV